MTKVCILTALALVVTPVLIEAQGDGCPDSGSAGNQEIVLTASKGSCAVTEGKYVRLWDIIEVDLWATTSGYCDVYTTPPSCPLQETQNRYLRASNISGIWNNSVAYSLAAVQPAHGTVAYYNTVGTINTIANPYWMAFYVGPWRLENTTNVIPTMCSFQPIYPAAPINVFVATGFHRGAHCGGSLIGGSQLGENEGTGRYHEHGEDPPETQDTWGVDEALLQRLRDVGINWNLNYPSAGKMGILDLSDPGGGPALGHSCHQNGLTVDVRYVRTDHAQQALNLVSQPSLYSKTLTIALLQTFVNFGGINRILVSSAADITAADIPGVEIDTGTVHDNHFHVELLDPDGPDSNNCI